MIYVQRHYNMQHKTVSINYLLSVDLEEGLEYVEEVLCELIPLIYLKEEGSDNLMEVKLIDNQVVISYILDLFNFEQEIKNALK